MWLLLLAIIAVLLCFLLALFYLHIPLPAEFADRQHFTKMDIAMRLLLSYPANVVDFLFGSKMRIKYFRFLLDQMFGFQKPNLSGLEVVNDSIGDVRVRIYTPHQKQSRGALVFFHGGGWVAVKPEFYDVLLASLVRRLGVTVISVDYRLAPEHPFPAPVDDCERVVKDLYENSYEKFDIDREKLCIVGDSAGGNLAAVVAQRFARRNEHFIKCQVLIYPVIHVFGFCLPSYQEYYENYNGSAILSPIEMARIMLLYLDMPATKRNVELLTAGQHIPDKLRASEEFRDLNSNNSDSTLHKQLHAKVAEPDENEKIQLRAFATKGSDPDVSPLFGVRSDLPPAMVVSAEFDVLRDEAIQYAKKLQKEKIPCEWKHYKTACHGVCSIPRSSVKRDIIADVCSFLKTHL
uniref:Abhydrolase_3 domain-containing protein n=1 Tax=Haemonchus contortus TaxID=6289 RepID=A0A7I4XWW1_HAECO|nr:Alpha beta hydrolase fold-3 domain containing protein [Haemonchus contortus]